MRTIESEYLRKFSTERPDGKNMCNVCGRDWYQHFNDRCKDDNGRWHPQAHDLLPGFSDLRLLLCRS